MQKVFTISATSGADGAGTGSGSLGVPDGSRVTGIAVHYATNAPNTTVIEVQSVPPWGGTPIDIWAVTGNTDIPMVHPVEAVVDSSNTAVTGWHVLPLVAGDLVVKMTVANHNTVVQVIVFLEDDGS